VEKSVKRIEMWEAVFDMDIGTHNNGEVNSIVFTVWMKICRVYRSLSLEWDKSSTTIHCKH
jgi:hypothetical protein